MKKPSANTVIFSALFLLIAMTFWNNYKPVAVKLDVNHSQTSVEKLKNIEDETTPLTHLHSGEHVHPVHATHVESKTMIDTIEFDVDRKMTGFMINGVKNGLWSYYQNDHLYQKVTFENDIMNGYASVYNEVGEKISEGEYVNGEQGGIWHVFKGGKLQQVEEYVNGKRISYHRMPGLN